MATGAKAMRICSKVCIAIIKSAAQRFYLFFFIKLIKKKWAGAGIRVAEGYGIRDAQGYGSDGRVWLGVGWRSAKGRKGGIVRPFLLI